MIILDLTGQTFGGVTVLRQTGSTGQHKIYLVRCLHCGREREMTSKAIKAGPESCGCLWRNSEHQRAASVKGTAASHKDGIEIYAVTRTEPNADNTTGYRWVRVQRRHGKEFIYATWRIQGRRYYKGGFATVEDAWKWAEQEHARQLEEMGITDPRIKED